MTPHLAYPKCSAILLLGVAALMPVSTPAATPDPVKLAIFDFEFEDMSAAASSTTFWQKPSRRQPVAIKNSC